MIGALQSEDSVVVYQAAAAIYQYPTEDLTSVMMSNLNNRNSKVRGFMALSLARLGKTDAVPAIVKACEAEAEPTDRRGFARALVVLKDPRGAPCLELLATSDPSEDSRRWAERQLQKMAE